MIKGREENMTVELMNIVEVDDWDESYALKRTDGMSMGVAKSECGDFVPKAGDWMLVKTHGFNTIAGVIIEGRVIRNKSVADMKEDRKRMLDGFRLEKLERYVKHGDALKARAAALPKPLAERMARFAAEDGVEFWIDSAGYEMAVMEGATALLKKVQELGYIADIDDPSDEGNDIEGALVWIEDWWSLNTEKHGYDYKKQMEIVPDFGDGHSGFTASAAMGYARILLKGEAV